MSKTHLSVFANKLSNYSHSYHLISSVAGFQCDFGKRTPLTSSGLKDCGIVESPQNGWGVVSGYGSLGNDVSQTWEGKK